MTTSTRLLFAAIAAGFFAFAGCTTDEDLGAHRTEDAGGNPTPDAPQPDGVDAGSDATAPAPVTPGAFTAKGTRSHNGEAVAITLGDPSDSKLYCWKDADGVLRIQGKNAEWEATLSLDLDELFKAPAKLTLVTFPSKVSGVSFTKGAGRMNAYAEVSTTASLHSPNKDFFVQVSSFDGARVVGTFKGPIADIDRVYELDISEGTFDLPIGEPPPK